MYINVWAELQRVLVAVMRNITLLGGSSSLVSRVNRRSSGGKSEGGGLGDQVEDDRLGGGEKVWSGGVGFEYLRTSKIICIF